MEVNAIRKNLEEVKAEITKIDKLSNLHREYLAKYYDKLHEAGIEPDKGKVLEHVNSLLSPLECKVKELLSAIEKRIEEVNNLVLEYTNVEIIEKETLERALTELEGELQALQDARIEVQQLTEQLTAIRRRYQ